MRYRPVLLIRNASFPACRVTSTEVSTSVSNVRLSSAARLSAGDWMSVSPVAARAVYTEPTAMDFYRLKGVIFR